MYLDTVAIYAPSTRTLSVTVRQEQEQRQQHRHHDVRVERNS